MFNSGGGGMNNKNCLTCKYIKNMQTTITGMKCNNQNSDTYGEYVDYKFSCKKWEHGNEVTPERFIMLQVKKIALENKKQVTLKAKIIQSINHYEERLEEEKEYKNAMSKEISRIEGRIEIIRDVIDDLKHDLMDVGEVVK